jgi:hypothetical protein
MHAFHLQPRMLSFLGGFYPRGHCFVMFPDEPAARRGEMLLMQAGVDCSDVSHLTPADVLSIAHTFDRYDVVLPSVGTDEETTRHFEQLARAGHHALLIPARNAQACQRITQALHGAGASYAVHYRNFVIEDLSV